MSEDKELGIIVGVAKPDYVRFESRRPVSVGEYVVMQNNGEKILALVERSTVKSDALGDGIRNYDEAFECLQVATENKRDKSYKGEARIIGYLEKLRRCKAVMPALPPEPGTRVFEATSNDLAQVFAPDNSEWAHMGSLLRNSQVEVKVNIDKVVSRHLAVLAMTGMGKSNLVSLLAKEVARVGGTMIIFDYHDDYSTLDLGRNTSNLMQAKINPRMLDADKLAGIIDIADNATNQSHVLREALSNEVTQKKGEDFWDMLVAGARDVGKDKMYREAAAKVEDKIEYARKKLNNILDPGMMDPVTLIKNGKINIINLVELSEKQANIAVSYYLEELLDDRKRATRQTKDKKDDRPARFNAPVLVVIEEAHVFVPKDEKTDTKYFASKVAREGRKFGLGLVIVSQRPRSIDANILSQMGSLAVMRMIQQDDQAQVSAASEALSKDLIDQLPSLNPGEAVFAGQWVNLPTFVRADEVKERKIGGDQKAVEQWTKMATIKDIAREASDSYMPSGYTQD